MDFIAIPLSYLLKFLYDTIAFQNYGLTIIFFTLVIKIIMLPLTIKQTKSTAKQQELQPEIAKLQKRYKNDKEKLNKEMMKFYKENNFNPASGCLPLLVQFPILISLYWIVLEPIKFLLQYHKIYGGNEKRMLLRKISGVPLGDMKADIGALSSFSKDDSAFNANDQLIYNKSQFIDENGNFILKNVAMQEKTKQASYNAIANIDRKPIFIPEFWEPDLSTESGRIAKHIASQPGWEGNVKPEDIFYIQNQPKQNSTLGDMVYDFLNNELYKPIMEKNEQVGREVLYKSTEYFENNNLSAKEVFTADTMLINSKGDIVNSNNEILFEGKGKLEYVEQVFYHEGTNKANKSILIDSLGNALDGDGVATVSDGATLLEKSQLINFNFLGLDLSLVPQWKPAVIFGDPATYVPLFILVLIAVAITYFSSKMAMPKQDPNKKKESAQPGPAGNMGKTMQYFGPFMTLMIAFIMPAGAVLYWAVSSLFQWLQQIYINKFVKGKKKEA